MIYFKSRHSHHSRKGRKIGLFPYFTGKTQLSNFENFHTFFEKTRRKVSHFVALFGGFVALLSH